MHMQTHTDDDIYLCQLCDKQFATNLLLKNHTQIHQLTIHLQCAECPKTFINKRSLSLHMGNHFSKYSNKKE